MSNGLKSFLLRWVANTFAVLIAANVVNGIRYDSVVGLLIASLLLGILNAFVRPLLLFLSLPFVLVMLGIGILFINALMLYTVGWLVKPFHVDGFWAAFWGALVIGIVSFIVNALTGTGNARVQVRTRGARPPAGRDDQGGGPVIDV